MRRHDVLGNRFRLRAGSSGLRAAARVQEACLWREVEPCFAICRKRMLIESADVLPTVAVEGGVRIAVSRYSHSPTVPS